MQPTHRIWRTTLVVLIFLQSACLRAGARTIARSNFVIIMVDDMGYGDAGCYGGTAYPTPGIDQLAAEGLKFTDFHSGGCVCSPTRAGLLTGRYQQRSGVDGVIYAAFNRNRHHGLQHSEITFAEVLKAAGYQTAAFGKWHLGYETAYNPIHQGFDRYVGYVSGNVDFHTHIDGAGVFDWWHQDQPNREAGYTTHLITKHACDFITGAAARQDKPFCVYIAHEAPHDPYQGPHDNPVRQEGSSKLLYNHRESRHAERAYAEMMAEMDEGVSEVLRTLRAADADSNTLVMFFSDNGATGPGSCGPLYGMKGSLWEGGHRVPGIARWPGVIPACSESAQLACTMDVMPTILDIAGVSAPADKPLDGQSLLPTFSLPSSRTDRRLFWQYGEAVCMRDGDWKLIVHGGKRPARSFPNIDWKRKNDGRDKLALFDLRNDPGEHHNLATQNQQRVNAMTAAIQEWQQDVADGATSQPGRAE